MRTRAKVVLGFALGVLGLFLLVVAVPYSHSDGRCVVRVRGRLLDVASGTAVVGVEVLSFPDRDGAADPDEVALGRDFCEGFAETRDEYVRSGEPGSLRFAPMWGAATTDREGRFEFYVGVPWSWTTWLGIPLHAERPPPRHGVVGLRIERPEGPVRIVELTGGIWQARPADDELWATWDLGEVRVSFDE